MGQTKHGVYDAVDEVDPDLLHRYYGAAENQENRPSDGTEAGSPPSNSGSGSESPSDSESSSGSESPSDSESSSNSDSGDGAESDSDGAESDGDGGSDTGDADVDLADESEAGSAGSWRGIAQIIAAAQGRNVRHDAAEVAKSNMPFINADEGHAFAIALGNALSLDEHPAGFCLNDKYESSESYRTGRSSRPLVIPLPHEIWFPRILVWCKALDLLMRLELTRE